VDELWWIVMEITGHTVSSQALLSECMVGFKGLPVLKMPIDKLVLIVAPLGLFIKVVALGCILLTKRPSSFR
jgi:hypothetical protein